jgi:hypothetical protein
MEMCEDRYNSDTFLWLRLAVRGGCVPFGVNIDSERKFALVTVRTDRTQDSNDPEG